MRKVSQDILDKAISKWGKHAQLLMVLEEMSELQKEILKNINRGKDNIDDIIDETADVEIMLDQMKYIYGIDEDVAKRIPLKLKKVKARLED
jgi:NTP pyrophosphatase (non-canonical NTP hydrolase)